MKKLSVVVPTFNSEDDIKRLLDFMIFFGTYKYLEVIVVDSSSTDNTCKIARKYPFVRVIQSVQCSKGEARNIGVRAATCDMIANIDSDVTLTAEWPQQVISSLTLFPIVAGYSPSPTVKKHLSRVPMLHHGQDITWPCCNIAHRKSVFKDVGFFHESYRMSAEDCDFNFRCIDKGYVIHYNPKMIVWHHQRDNFSSFCKQAYWNGYYRKGLLRLHPELNSIHNISIKSLIRLGFGFLGYITGDLRSKKGEKH